MEKLQGKWEKSGVFLLSSAGENHGIDFWLTACQQGQPESVNRGGVKTLTPGNNDQKSVVVDADAFTCWREGRNHRFLSDLCCFRTLFLLPRPIHGQFGRNKTLQPFTSRIWRVQLQRAPSFLAANLPHTWLQTLKISFLITQNPNPYSDPAGEQSPRSAEFYLHVLFNTLNNRIFLHCWRPVKLFNLKTDHYIATMAPSNELTGLLVVAGADGRGLNLCVFFPRTGAEIVQKGIEPIKSGDWILTTCKPLRGNYFFPLFFMGNETIKRVKNGSTTVV